MDDGINGDGKMRSMTWPARLVGSSILLRRPFMDLSIAHKNMFGEERPIF